MQSAPTESGTLRDGHLKRVRALNVTGGGGAQLQVSRLQPDGGVWRGVTSPPALLRGGQSQQVELGHTCTQKTARYKKGMYEVLRIEDVVVIWPANFHVTQTEDRVPNFQERPLKVQPTGAVEYHGFKLLIL